MIVYEVSVDVPEQEAAAYRVWLQRHITEMLALPGFLSARLQTVLQEAAPLSSATTPANAGAANDLTGNASGNDPDNVQLMVSYRLIDQLAMQRYFDEFAPRLRSLAASQFGKQYPIRRRVLALEREFYAHVATNPKRANSDTDA